MEFQFRLNAESGGSLLFGQFVGRPVNLAWNMYISTPSKVTASHLIMVVSRLLVQQQACLMRDQMTVRISACIDRRPEEYYVQIPPTTLPEQASWVNSLKTEPCSAKVPHVSR